MGNRAGAFCSGSVCPKSGPHAVGDHELYDDATMCDPAGAVFQETLEDLNEVDRLLANFASTSNLAAVRWLFILGANFDACDTNGTTCLHAACRSGSPAVVREFIQRELPLDATDTAGWTPLHVALFMGRRSVAVELMQSGADLTTRNLQGHSPADLCSDVWLREAIDACVAHRRAHGPSVPWRCEHETQEDVKVASRLRFEPFFVPRAPVLKDLVGCTDLLELGTEIFNQRPGQGLAFLVATGCVRDFPVELSNFLSENRVSPAMVGEFLGEDFSLSQTLRLEYINSVRVVGTGIVSCLTKVFQKFHLPSDLHKIDRLIDAVAQIWWRQHEQIKDKTVVPDALSGADSGEVEGLSLMKHVGDHDALHQLMLSAVLLHWNLYSPLPPSQRMTPARWIEMNSGIAAGKGSRDDPTRTSMLKHIQCLVYNLISHTFYPQLQIWSSRCPSGIIGPGMIPKTPSSHPSADESGPPAAGAFAHEQGAVDGWASLIGGSFPSLAGSSLTVTYRQIRGILSETTSTTLVTPMTSRSSRAGVEPQQEQQQRQPQQQQRDRQQQRCHCHAAAGRTIARARHAAAQKPRAGARHLAALLLVGALLSCLAPLPARLAAWGYHLAAQPRLLLGQAGGGQTSGFKVQRRAAPVAPAPVTIEKMVTDLEKRVQAMEKPEDELNWRVLAYCTACRTPWCKLPWRRHTCLKGDSKAEGTSGKNCDMPWEHYTDILVKSIPLISRQKAQVLTRECWRQADASGSGVGAVTCAIVPRPAAQEYCSTLSKNGIQCSVAPDSFFHGGKAS